MLAHGAFEGLVVLGEGAVLAARAVVSLPGSNVEEFEALCAERGVAVSRLGEVTGEPELEFVGQFTVGLGEAESGWKAPIPAAMA